MNEETQDYKRYSEAIKATFYSIIDFEKYWLNKNLEFIKKYPGIGTEEEAKEITAQTVSEIGCEFKEGDKIIHYDDHGIFKNSRMEREYVILKRENVQIKSVLISMS